MPGRIEIDDVAARRFRRKFPAKAVVGEVVPVCATVWREGHDAVAATLVVRYHGTRLPAAGHRTRQPASRRAGADRGRAGRRPGSNRSGCRWSPGATPDVFHGQFVPDAVGLWTFRVDGWGDPIATWRKAVIAKLDAGQSETELSNDLLIGAKLLERAATGVPRQHRAPLLDAAAALRDARRSADPRPARRCPPRSPTCCRTIRCANWSLAVINTASGWTDPLARFSAWYELFPRSTGGWDADGEPGARHLRHRRQGAAPGREDGFRRGLPAADPPDRQGAPQGPQQHRDRRAG